MNWSPFAMHWSANKKIKKDFAIREHSYMSALSLRMQAICRLDPESTVWSKKLWTLATTQLKLKIRRTHLILMVRSRKLEVESPQGTVLEALPFWPKHWPIIKISNQKYMLFQGLVYLKAGSCHCTFVWSLVFAACQMWPEMAFLQHLDLVGTIFWILLELWHKVQQDKT